MENEVEGDLLMEEVWMIRDSGEPDRWMKNTGKTKENPWDNLLDPPSALRPRDLAWKGGASRDVFLRRDRFVP